MNYRNPGQKTRILRRLWEVPVYVGDPDDPDAEVKMKTCVAWNQTDAIRMFKNVAKPPQHKCYVTWPMESGSPVYEIYDTAGPSDVEVHPDIPIPDSDEEWNF
jgi:hypothetical protein